MVKKKHLSNLKGLNKRLNTVTQQVLADIEYLEKCNAEMHDANIGLAGLIDSQDAEIARLTEQQELQRKHYEKRIKEQADINWRYGKLLLAVQSFLAARAAGSPWGITQIIEQMHEHVAALKRLIDTGT